jgi:putative hemolysin
MLYLDILFILLLTLINGLLAMSELAVVSSRRTRLVHMAGEGSRGARMALRLIGDPGRFLSTVQIGITLVGILAGAVSGATIAERLGAWLDTLPSVAPNGDAIAIGLLVLCITYLSLIVGELVPKRIAMNNPERVASAVARPMNLLSRIAAPAVWLLKASTEAVLHALGLNEPKESTVTEEEVKSLIAEGTQAGIFVPQEREMIEGVLRLADRPVRAIMTPRTEIYWLDADADHEATMRKLEETRFSRLLVCKGSVDHAVGVVHTKDLLPRTLRGEAVKVDEAMVPPLAVSETTPVLRLLDLFRRGGVHMAVILDEYGITQGVATPTDILEAIAGDLSEQGDEAEPPMVQREDGSWLVDGSLPIDEFEDRLGLRDLAKTGAFHTVAGFVLHHLGRLPGTGETFDYKGARFEVVDMDGRRIDKILVTLPKVG